MRKRSEFSKQRKRRRYCCRLKSKKGEQSKEDKWSNKRKRSKLERKK